MTGPIAYIVDDLEVNRDLLESLLRTVGIETRSFESGQSFLDGVVLEQSGCVLMDIRMPGMSGLDAQRELNARGSVLPVIMVTAHGDVPVAIQAMKDGAYEFIEKPINNQLLLDVVQRAFKLCEELQGKKSEIEEIRKNYENLSPREIQVLKAVAEGRLNKQIAFDLRISQRTVEVHRSNLMLKMKANSLADIVRMVIALDDRSIV